MGMMCTIVKHMHWQKDSRVVVYNNDVSQNCGAFRHKETETIWPAMKNPPAFDVLCENTRHADATQVFCLLFLGFLWRQWLLKVLQNVMEYLVHSACIYLPSLCQSKIIIIWSWNLPTFWLGRDELSACVCMLCVTVCLCMYVVCNCLPVYVCCV